MAKHPRQSTLDALNKFCEKQLDNKPKKLSKPHGKPEKEVEKACLAWMRSQGWNVQIFEAKATWSPDAQRWLQQSMKAGTCDCLGNTNEGLSVAIEFKAPGALSSFNSDKRYLQKKFIIDKIHSCAFACVVDSLQSLQLIYAEWNVLRKYDMEKAKLMLLSKLPKMSAKREKQEKLFDEE